ncbi:hypothetical protein CXF83_21785 [Shewanella sp. Choline-02u-19]|uniref:hypothetical protein n=1 Tax=unclassified Shewanella TaxID=196818 RepID=UPI000C322BA4|nr:MULTISPECIES: hypothetical protein [unclassified Shewanella]PKH60390.1 hypothetical protein CXF84_02590 [Shewanella sp. Bg11-22]PKI29149.1 hypothetical protein CXF83_21785 [Shewanella sp. Choline-02u-19]
MRFLQSIGSSTIIVSTLLLSGCQLSAQQQRGGDDLLLNQVTRTKTVNLTPKYDERMGFNFIINDPLQFDLPLSDIVYCGLFGESIEGKRGTLYISKVESSGGGVRRQNNVYGYVESNQMDISKCRATVEYQGVFKNSVKISEGYSSEVLPKFRELISFHKDLTLQNKERKRQQAIIKSDEKQKASWHIRELNNTAQGIATIQVCMEKGTFFLSSDKRAKQAVKESESYARNDIRSKVDGKHYWNQKAYKQAHQKGLNLSRYLWLHDYLTFSNQCAAMRNLVDSVTN